MFQQFRQERRCQQKKKSIRWNDLCREWENVNVRDRTLTLIFVNILVVYAFVSGPLCNCTVKFIKRLDCFCSCHFLVDEPTPSYEATLAYSCTNFSYLAAYFNIFAVCADIKYNNYNKRGTRWRSWVRQCLTSRKVAGSILDGVFGIFH